MRLVVSLTCLHYFLETDKSTYGRTSDAFPCVVSP